MKTTQQSSEKGQALVLLVLGMVVLLGFTALAVDGGMVYSDRRHAQNASDASSLAGGAAAGVYLENHYVTSWNWDNCTNSHINNAEAEAIDAAILRAGDNNFVIDNDISDKLGATTDCGEVDNGSWVDRYLDIRTLITMDTPTSFAQIVYGGPLRNTVEAITRVRPRTPSAFGNAIVALSDACDGHEGGVTIEGTSGVVVTGGGIFSNACIVTQGSVDTDVTGGDITCFGDGCYDSNGHPSISPAPEEGAYQLPEDATYIPPPDCASLPSRDDPHGSETIRPGRYSSRIRINSGDTIVMEPGLYCLNNGITINGGGTLVGSEVSIYLVSGDFDASGGAAVNLDAPPAQNCANCPPAIPGVLIYLAEDNEGTAFLRGNSDSDYVGTVYVPNGAIEVGGTADAIHVHAQLIAWTVKVHGTSTVEVNFDEQLNFQQPAKLELFK